MGSSSPPPSQDYKAAAVATAAGNQNAAISQQIGNMTNQAGVEQYKLDPTTGAQVLGADGKPISLGSTGVTYNNPYTDLDARGSIKFDMSSLTQKQIDAYLAGKGLPKDFAKTYLPEQWTQQSTLGGNDRTLYDQSQAAQLGLSGIALQGLDAVKQATDPNDPRYKKIDPSIAVQGGPANTAERMRTAGDTPIFVGGNLNTSGLQTNVNNAGVISNNIGQVNGTMQHGTGANTLASSQTGATGVAGTSIQNNADKINTSAQTKLDNNGNLIRLDSGANQQAGALGTGLNNSTSIQTKLGLDPNLLNQQAVDALYKANTQYLDPQFVQSQSKMESQLANQGITRGSEAYNNAMLNFNNQKQQAYTDARNQAIGQGTAAAQGLFGMGLQGAQFGNTSLGQQFGQNVTAQQLANSAAGQNNTTAQTNQQLYNSALGQQFGQGLQAADFGNRGIAQNNAALGQQFGQNLQAGQFANQAVAQNNANALANAQFGNQAVAQNNANAVTNANFANTAQQQSYDQALGKTNLANTAQAQQYGQNLSDLQNFNAATAQRFDMDTANQAAQNNAQQQQYNASMANADMYNQQLSQLYNQNLQSAQLGNQASNQQLAQNQAIQQNPLNILQALRTGSQLNTANLPAVGVSQPAQLANWQGADFLGAANAQGQYNQSVYNAQTAADSQLTSALIGAGGALGGGALSKYSDRRLKKNIKRIGTHVLGIGLYTWDYLWGQPFSGVMADEVEQVMPEAVAMHPSGFKMVNYSMLGLL
jgi:hypothetical protein